MPGFDGTGPNGMGPMTGGGRGFCSPWGVGRGRYVFPRQANYAFPRYGAYSFTPFTPQMSREQELDYIKSQAEALRNELNALEAEIGKLSAGKE